MTLKTVVEPMKPSAKRLPAPGGSSEHSRWREPIPSLAALDMLHRRWHYESIVEDATRLVPNRTKGAVRGCEEAQTARDALDMLRTLWEEFKREHELH